MSVRRKGTRWEVRIRSGAGRRIEQRLPAGATRNDAQALEVALRRRLIESATGRTDYTLIEALNRWQLEAQRLKSWEKDLKYRAGVLRELAGRYKLSQLVDVAEAIKAHGTANGLTPATINRYLAILKRIGNLALKWGWTQASLGARIESMAGERRRTVFVTQPQLRKLMAAADPRLRDLLQLSVLTGLRRGELLRMTHDNLVDRTLVLDAQTKSGLPRVVPLPKGVLAIARRALPAQIRADNLRKLFDQARAAAGLPHVRWHDLRRTYGTWLIQGGANLAQVRDLLGHSDIKTTSVYLSTTRPDLRAAVRNLPRVGEVRGTRPARRTAKKVA